MHYVRRKVDAAWCWKGERNERARKNSGKRGRRGGNERGGRRIIRIARSRYADSRRERSYFAGRFRGMGKREEKQVWRRCGWKTRGEPGTGRDRLVFSIYSRGEKLNRIRCRIRVSIFHKIGGKAEYRGSFVSKNTPGSIFSTVTRYFSKNFVRGPRFPGQNAEKLRYTRAGRPRFFSRVCKLCVKDRDGVSDLVSCECFADRWDRCNINVFILRLIEINQGFELV